MYPKFKVLEKSEEKLHLRLSGSISTDSHKNEKWIDDKWLGFLRNGNLMIFGRWSKNADSWNFSIKSEDASEANFIVGEEYTVFDGYWGERVEIVIDKNKKWSREIFKTKGGNDHDHCFFCWAKISEFENREFVTDHEGNEVCLNCFERYIEKENFGFIVTPKSYDKK